jgi:hypothetical protein
VVKLKGNLLWSTQTLPYTTPKPTTPRAPGQRHQHHLHQSPMHALLWALGAAVTILLLGGIIATYHHYAGVAHSRAAEQREQRFLADASELEQLRGGPARRDASLLDLFRYRYCKVLTDLSSTPCPAAASRYRSSELSTNDTLRAPAPGKSRAT